MLKSEHSQRLSVIAILAMLAIVIVGASAPYVLASPNPGQVGAIHGAVVVGGNGDDFVPPPMLEDMQIGGISVLLLIILLVQVGKDWFGLAGNNLRFLSVGLGILFGFLYQATVGFPTTVAHWIVFSVRLLYGVLASGLVDLTRDVFNRTGSKAIKAVIERALAK